MSTNSFKTNESLGIVIGLPDLMKQLQELPKKVANAGARKAVTAAGGPILAADRAGVPIRTGLLKQSLTKKTVKLRNGFYACLIGAKHLRITKKRKKPGFKVRKGIQKKLLRLGFTTDQALAKTLDINFVDPTRYLHLVEKGARHPRGGKSIFGRGLRSIRKVFAARGGASHFMEHGQTSAAGQAESLMAETLRTFIASEVHK